MVPSDLLTRPAPDASPAGTDGAAPAGQRPRSGRDPFLDLVRAVATARVVLWHAYGAAAITWVVAAIPTMCFVTGDLLAASAGRQPATAVVRDRLRRIAVPLWVLTVVVWCATALHAAATGTPLRAERALLWFVPFVDPPATEWEDGWLSSPLWYLRVLFWLLLLSPLLLRAAARFPGRAVAVGVAGVLATDHLVRSAAWAPGVAPDLWWYAADLFLYGTFLVAGAAHRMGSLPFGGPRRRLAAAGAAALLAAGWVGVVDLGTWVVNDSHPLHLLVGAAWLALILAAEGPLRRLAVARPVAPVVRLLGRRALTIYLWHTAAIVVALGAASAAPDGLLGPAAFPVAVVVLVAGAVVTFGWVEDLAAGRSARVWPAGRPGPGTLVVVVTLAVGCGALALVAPADADESLHRPPVPSQRPPTPRALAAGADDAFVVDGPGHDAAELPGVLDGMLARWAAAEGTAGVVAGVRGADGQVWTGAWGEWPDTGEPAAVGDRFDAQSVMKMFTGAAVLRAADEGLLDLDGPLPRLDRLPALADLPGVTPRRLMAHRAGLPDFRQAPGYAEAVESDRVLTAVEAVELALEQGPRKPGGRPDYTSTNYLVLGLVLEQLHGRSVDELLADTVLEPAGMAASEPVAPRVSEPNSGGGGLATTVDDLLVGAEALLGRTDTFGDAVTDAMRAPDVITGHGAGTIGFCPCRDSYFPDRFALVGHMGGGTLVAWAPESGVTVALHVTDSLWEVEDRLGRAARLLARMAAHAERAWSPS